MEPPYHSNRAGRKITTIFFYLLWISAKIISYLFKTQ